jgi:hypothetical protein
MLKSAQCVLEKDELITKHASGVMERVGGQ